MVTKVHTIISSVLFLVSLVFYILMGTSGTGQDPWGHTVIGNQGQVKGHTLCKMEVTGDALSYQWL